MFKDRNREQRQRKGGVKEREWRVEMFKEIIIEAYIYIDLDIYTCRYIYIERETDRRVRGQTLC